MDNDGLSVSLDGENMATYCTELAKKHDVSKKKTGQFKTTGGSIINVPVASSGQTVDGNKLYEAIAEAINNKKSATVEAVYSEAKEEETGEYVTYGGNYCEVDLTNQMVYVYKMESLLYQVSVLQDVFQKDTEHLPECILFSQEIRIDT